VGVRDAGLQDSGELVSIVIIGIVLNGVASCSARSLAQCGLLLRRIIIEPAAGLEPRTFPEEGGFHRTVFKFTPPVNN
jgi:hypothetical protein